MSEIEIRALTKHYGSTPVVNEIDLTIQDGEFVSLLGPSGCGKTTTLRCIAGLEHPDSGQIRIASDLVSDGRRGLSVPPNKRRLGMVFQSYALWPHMNVFANVAYPLKVQHTPRQLIAARVKDALRLVGLEDLAQRGISELSGGQQQRIALARAMASDPKVLLLDEPLSNLDASLRAHMRRELRRIHQEVKTTSVYVTHDQLEAVTLSDRVIVLNKGKIQQSGAPHEVFNAPANRWVAGFVGFENFIGARVLETRGRTLLAQPDGWQGAVTCRLGIGAACPVAGAKITLAARASSFLARPAAGANTVSAQVVEATYVGDATEYVLDAHGTRLTARFIDGQFGLQTHGSGPSEPGSVVEVAIPHEHIVALPA